MKRIFAVLVMIGVASAAFGYEVTFKDPRGDDDGSGAYIYPTDRVYTPGSFDLLEFKVKEEGKNYVFYITVGAKLENPWEMDSGFSIQMAQVYIDIDGVPGEGHKFALPGMNVCFFLEGAWEKAVIISPQPASRIKTEVAAKAADVADDVVVPIKVTPRGNTIIAVVKKSDLGIHIDEQTGFQVLLGSNEGFPDAGEILSRKVNEYEGQHRFGGGSDYSGDAHFMDMLYPPGKGTDAEIEGQHACLSKYMSGSNPAQDVWSRLKVVRKRPSDWEAKSAPIPAPEPADKPAGEPASERGDTRVVGFKAPPPKPQGTVSMGELGMSFSGKIYTSWLYGNDVSEHSVYIDPFGDGGHNGTNSELELRVNARISDYVEAGARIKNRFRKNYWATYWDNNDLDEAQYMKLRGVWVRFKLPDWISPLVESVHVGSSDLGMFNAWTVGRIRYIDRDNAMGSFFSGRIGDKFAYDIGRISLPEPWAGPGWSTRGKGYFTADGFFTNDYALAAALNFDVHDRFRFRLVGDYTKDREGDQNDENLHDGVDRVTRYQNTVVSAEFDSSPLDFMDLSGVFAWADSNYRAQFDYIEKRDANPIPQKDLDDTAMTVLIQLNDPFSVGLSFALEYFNIGEDFVTLMGARRETDVLITEGFEGDDAVGAFDWGGWWGTMGQVPSLNVDNNETQFDETCYQTIVGWKGQTLLASFDRGSFGISAEFTLIDYNTNMQGRDMGVYWDGHGFGAPGNAYNEYQERDTAIAVIKGSYAFEAVRPFDLSFRVKNIDDVDDRDLSTSADDYENDKWVYDFGLGCQVFDELYLKGGITLYDKEFKLGGDTYGSEKNRLYFILRYDFGGVRFGYAVEQFTGEDWDGDWDTGEVAKFDDWDLVRSHAFLEVAF